MESLMSNDASDKIQHETLQYERHQEKYRNGLIHGITPCDLQLKKIAQIGTISQDFLLKLSNIFYETEHIYNIIAYFLLVR